MNEPGDRSPPVAPRAVAFDLDGTLVDSRLDLAAAVNLARADFDLPPHAVEAVLGMVGEGARNLVRRAFGEPEPARLERALERFFVHYEVECTRRTRPYPGIEAATWALAGRCPLAIVTNKPERFSCKILDALGWRERFAELVGGDSLPSRKPDPAGLCEVARRLGVPPAELLFVGDSRIDAATALAAGAPFVFVEWGFAGDAERRELAAARRIRQPEELLELVPAPQRMG